MCGTGVEMSHVGSLVFTARRCASKFVGSTSLCAGKRSLMKSRTMGSSGRGVGVEVAPRMVMDGVVGAEFILFFGKLNVCYVSPGVS